MRGDDPCVTEKGGGSFSVNKGGHVLLMMAVCNFFIKILLFFVVTNMVHDNKVEI